MSTISTDIDFCGDFQPLSGVDATHAAFPDWELLQRSTAVVDYIDGLFYDLESCTRPGTLLEREIAPLDAELSPNDDTSTHAGIPARRPGGADHLVDAVFRLLTWLGVSVRDGARAAGIDRGTFYAWQRRPGTHPHNGSTGSVLRLHNIVASAVDAVGEEPARTWFHSGSPSPLQELIGSNGDPETVAAVGRLVRHHLARITPPPPNPRLAASIDDLTEGRNTASPWE